MVTASEDKTARIWDAESGKEIAVLKGPTNIERPTAVFSPDGKRVVTAFADARIWDANSGKEIVILAGHTAAVMTVAFSADGKRVVTGSWDNTARIWDAVSGKEIAALKGHTGSVGSAVFSRDGKRVVTASENNDRAYLGRHLGNARAGRPLRERVCAEKLIGPAQEFTDGEMEDPILRGIDKTIRSRAIPACAAGRCRSTTGHVFRASFGVRSAGSPACIEPA